MVFTAAGLKVLKPWATLKDMFTMCIDTNLEVDVTTLTNGVFNLYEMQSLPSAFLLDHDVNEVFNNVSTGARVSCLWIVKSNVLSLAVTVQVTSQGATTHFLVSSQLTQIS